MPQHHHQTFDQQGNLLSETIEEYTPVEPEPTINERISALERDVADMRSRVAGVATNNTDVSEIRDAITGKPNP